MQHISIKSLSTAMPKNHVTNDVPPYSLLPNLPPNWWRFWGIKGRYLINRDAGETAESLAVRACNSAIKNSGLVPTDIDLIICNSTCFVGWSEDRNNAFPRLADRMSKVLGCTKALTMDIEQECITFLIAMQIASNYISSGKYKNVLVCSAEYISGVLDFSDKSCSTFGDGAAAAILSSDTDNGKLLSSAYSSNADFYELATVKWQFPENKPNPEPKDYWSYFTLDNNAPAEMQKFVPTGVPTIVRKALEKTNLTISDIDYFVFHQPSKILVNLWANGLDIDEDKFLLTLEHYGCMVSVSMPVTLAESIKQQKIKSGDTIVIAGAATGWGFGAQIWQIGNVCVAEA
jgi:3-oxoacyl-[acyl-carrier-protein] synthase-3